MGVGWCSGQPVPCGGIHSRESVGSDPVLAPALEFCIWRSRFALPDYITARNQGDRGLPEPSKARASSPAGFHRVRQSNPGLWPRHSRRITRPRNDHRRSPANLPVAAWETVVMSGPRTTRPRSPANTRTRNSPDPQIAGTEPARVQVRVVLRVPVPNLCYALVPPHLALGVSIFLMSELILAASVNPEIY